MFEETTTYKRQQRRRAAIAWGVGGLTVVLLALSAVLGAKHDAEHAQPPNPFSYAMSSSEYDSVRPGLDREEFAERVASAGLPEDEVAPGYVRLFPPPGEGVSCSFWEITDRIGEVARICFSDADGQTVGKLEHGPGDGGEGGEEGEFGVSV